MYCSIGRKGDSCAKRLSASKNGKAVAKITPQTADQRSDPEWRAAFAVLRKSLRAKRANSFGVGTIIEDDKYGDDRA
jgi:hypothetical protein